MTPSSQASITKLRRLPWSWCTGCLLQSKFSSRRRTGGGFQWRSLAWRLASHPAYSTSQLLGGVLLNSMSATSALPSATNSALPEMLLLVGLVLPEQVLRSWLK